MKIIVVMLFLATCVAALGIFSARATTPSTTITTSIDIVRIPPLPPDG